MRVDRQLQIYSRDLGQLNGAPPHLNLRVDEAVEHCERVEVERVNARNGISPKRAGRTGRKIKFMVNFIKSKSFLSFLNLVIKNNL